MVLAHDERLPSPRERLQARAIDEVTVLAFLMGILVPGLIFEVYWLTIAGVVGLIFGWSVYDVVCVARWGRTLGKKVRGLRVVRLDDGGKPRVLQAIVRGLLLPFLFSGWGAYSVMSKRAHRGLHDRAAGTIVVYDL